MILSPFSRLTSPPGILTFPDVSDIIADRTVIRQMDRAWEMMLNNASPRSRSEYGFFIYYNCTTSSFYTGNIVDGRVTAGCMHTNASIALGIVTNNLECCACFHCHTTLQFCSGDNGRITGPSPSDENYARNYRLPGILYDYDDSIISGGDSMHNRHRIYTFGLKNRPDIHI